MQVPEHLVSLYVATCGQNGSGLGSDEKEVILLVYVIIEAATAQIVGIKQILVRPVGNIGVKDRTISTSSETSNSAASPSSPPPPLLSITNAPHNNATSPILGEAMAANVNGQTAVALIANGPPTNIDLPISVAQAAGKPLNEAIEEFDDYLRSLSLDTNFTFVTDGQLPLRQCLHPEACAKDIDLPTYYCKFSDLRKEYVKFKTGGDLSRALVPMKDIKKILQIPIMPTPQSISEMVKELSIISSEDSEFYVKESRDMVSVIQTLLKGGHKFYENEIVNLILEPGICSIDDEIDGGCIVRARGLPWQSSDQDIAKFFRGLNVAKGGVALCLSPLGRRNGEALVRFISQEQRDMALKRHKHHIGNRYIEVYRATGDDFLAIAGGASNEAQAFLSKGAQVIIRMRGLPYDCSAKQVLDFFTTGENPCDVLDGVEGVLFVKKPDGRATGDAFVLFALESDAQKALARHRESIGQRYIELFRSTTAEVQQVLNRSMDPKTYEAIHQPPLIAQLPSVQLSLLPQHLITSGTTKNCIRLRGLPYEALVEHILHFLDDYAKNIIYQGVHMVINAQGQPSGEAFIQMDSEEAARQCAQRKHNHFMVFGKKYRYIEVFQCSGDDMNMVLNGGLQSPVNHHTHHHASKQASLVSPGMLTQPQQSSAQSISTHTLQASTSVAAAVAAAALAQQQQHHHSHSHLANQLPSVAAVAAAGGLNPFLTTPHQHHHSVSHHTHPSAAAAAAMTTLNANTGTTNLSGGNHHVPQHHHHPHQHHHPNHSVAAVGAAHTHLQVQQQNVTAAGPQSSSGAATALSIPFNISLPSPAGSVASNSAIIAQQQAQFIAQQNLFARQQVAAAAAAAEQQQQQFYANLINPFYIHHPSAASAAATAVAHVSPSAAAAVGQSPQYVFMPRPYFHHFPIGGYLPSPQSYQFANAAQVVAAVAAAPTYTTTANASSLQASLQHPMKRTYDNAFQQDPNVASVPKRALTRTTGNVYSFYNPGV